MSGHWPVDIFDQESWAGRVAETLCTVGNSLGGFQSREGGRIIAAFAANSWKMEMANMKDSRQLVQVKGGNKWSRHQQLTWLRCSRRVQVSGSSGRHAQQAGARNVDSRCSRILTVGRCSGYGGCCLQREYKCIVGSAWASRSMLATRSW